MKNFNYEEMFYNALCNGLGELSMYGLQLELDNEEYKRAKANLDNPCYEDILMAILRSGGTLVVLDEEDENSRYEITLEDVHERVPNAPKWAIAQMINEEDDATTADVILQTVFLNEVIFG